MDSSVAMQGAFCSEHISKTDNSNSVETVDVITTEKQNTTESKEYKPQKESQLVLQSTKLLPCIQRKRLVIDNTFLRHMNLGNFRKLRVSSDCFLSLVNSCFPKCHLLFNARMIGSLTPNPQNPQEMVKTLRERSVQIFALQKCLIKLVFALAKLDHLQHCDFNVNTNKLIDDLEKLGTEINNLERNEGNGCENFFENETNFLEMLFKKADMILKKKKKSSTPPGTPSTLQNESPEDKGLPKPDPPPQPRNIKKSNCSKKEKLKSESSPSKPETATEKDDIPYHQYAAIQVQKEQNNIRFCFDPNIHYLSYNFPKKQKPKIQKKDIVHSGNEIFEKFKQHHQGNHKLSSVSPESYEFCEKNLNGDLSKKSFESILLNLHRDPMPMFNESDDIDPKFHYLRTHSILD